MRALFALLLFVTVARSEPVSPHAEAAARFDAQLKANPSDVDAAYNAGQAYYNLGKMELALDRWKKAQKLAPADFDRARRLSRGVLPITAHTISHTPP